MEKLNINVNGNRKLQNTYKIRFIIWNLPAVKTCPYSTPSCEKSCYARKAERIYPQVLPSRELNYTASLQPDFAENMIYTIETEINKKKYDGKKIVFRIHESGDFYSVEYVWKWEKIAKHFENDNRIVFLAYTKSIAFFTGIGKYGTEEFPKNFIVRSSIWNDTTPENIQLTTNYNFPIYTAGTEAEVLEKKRNGYHVCKCDNCGNCRMCWNSKIQNIIVKIH